jgi:hypothetical protein
MNSPEYHRGIRTAYHALFEGGSTKALLQGLHAEDDFNRGMRDQAAKWPEAIPVPPAGYDEDRESRLACALFMGIGLTEWLLALVAFRPLAGWAVGFLCFTGTMLLVAGYRLRKEGV